MACELDAEFLMEVEKSLGIQVPIQLKKLLAINGYTNVKIIATITEEDLNEIENFARNDLPYLIDKSEYNDYYGVFAKSTDTFKILNGHRKMLKMIQDYYKPNKRPIANSVSKISTSSSSSSSDQLSHAGTSKINFQEESASVSNLILHWIKAKCSDEKWLKLEEKCKKIIVAINNDNLNQGIVGNIFSTIKEYVGKN